MSESLHDRQRRWADSLPPLSDELRELACLLADEEARKIGAHPAWPLFKKLFQAEAGTDPDPAALGVICECPEHF
ncbi:hypothetical protein QZH56_11810 [Streptomyces olivoreticuli]|uniref:hypothetical protein n=1 Tax=Streptomyces olivoreticuli TaxID=68246 RepID=UPI0026597250|nr:hypothetical protein [Streptomyces olivoreticuli]WKK21015.1 hypothetical protein QZH56_19220 [Streptomyces olivoreticuli]WKK26210.1 hypothetical protein QZH56_11810 [Streptomyces olivoreticuli]